MIKTQLTALLLCLAATPAIAQTGFNGKWVTDPPDGAIRAEFVTEGDRVTGTLTTGGIRAAKAGNEILWLGGNPFTISDGKLNGNRIQFRTTYTSGGVTTWTGELVDENTLRLGSYLEVPPVSPLRSEPLRLQQTMPVSPPALSTPELSQTGPPGSVTGTATDSSKALIPGVTVRATAMDTNAVVTAVTDQSGAYTLNLKPGLYTISASLPGFQTRSITDINLSQDTSYRYNFELTVQSRPGPGAVLLHRLK